MRRSVTSLICGIIGSIFCLAWGFFVGLFGGLVNSIAVAATGSTDATINLIYFLGWLCFFGAIVGIVGAALCVKKARAGAICLTLATVMCGSLLIYVFVQIPATDMLPITRIVICLLPAALLAVSAVFAWIAKKVDNPNAYARQTIGGVTTSSASALENDLLKLKETFEKGLITEEEFNEARKKIIEKHM